MSTGQRAPAIARPAGAGRDPLRGPRAWAIAGLIATAGALVHANSFGNPFVWDDSYTIVTNPHLRHLWPLQSALGAPPGSCTSGRPVAALSLAVNYALGELNVFGYHFFNILVHVLAGLVLFGLVRRTLQLPRLAPQWGARATGIALAVALIWIVHPLHTAALGHVSYRTEALMGFFYLLTLYGFVRSVEVVSSARIWAGIAIAACFLGMASKEVMVSAPLLVLLYDRLFVSGAFRGALGRRKGFYAALASSWILLALLVASGNRGESVSIHIATCTPADYARTQFGVVAHYLRLTFWPHPLVIDYNWPVAKSLAAVLPAMLLVVGLWAAAIVALRRGSGWGFLGAFFFLVLAPSSSLMPLSGAIVGEHRMYLPLAAPVALTVLLVSLGIEKMGANLRWPRRIGGAVSMGLVTLTVVLLGLRTVHRNRDFRTETLLWTDALEKSPGNPRAHNNLGNALVREGKLDAAMTNFRAALAITPTDPQASYNMGLVLLRKADLPAATAAFRDALRDDPRMAEAHHDLGIALLQQGHYDEALAEFHAAIERNTAYAGAINNLAWLRATCPVDRLRNGAEAVQHAERAVWLTREKDPEMLDTLAAAYAEAGRFDAAVATAERAISMAAHVGRTDLQTKLTGRLELYRSQRPFRMTVPPSSSS